MNRQREHVLKYEEEKINVVTLQQGDIQFSASGAIRANHSPVAHIDYLRAETTRLSQRNRIRQRKINTKKISKISSYYFILFFPFVQMRVNFLLQ